METWLKARKEKKLTQKEVADKAGISLSAYQRYERGERSPSMAIFAKVNNALGLKEYDPESASDRLLDAFKIEINRAPDEYFADIEKPIEAFKLLNDLGKNRCIDYIEDIAGTHYNEIPHMAEILRKAVNYNNPMFEEKYILDLLQMLNPKGINTVKDYLNDLLSISKYSRSDSDQPLTDIMH